MLRFARIGLAAITLLFAACSAVDEPLPMETMENLNGKWQQVDGDVRAHFYPDETVKLTMPGETPEQLISPIEIIKDDQIGFSIGDRWSGPVHIEPAADWSQLELMFPSPDGKSEGKRLTLIKAD